MKKLAAVAASMTLMLLGVLCFLSGQWWPVVAVGVAVCVIAD